MINNKFIQLILSLSSFEKKQLLLFFQSPFYNKKNEYIACLEFFLDMTSQSQYSTDLTKQKTWAYVFPKKPFSDLKFRRLLSDMYKLAEEFMKAYHFKQHIIKGQSALLHEYNERSLNKLTPQVISNTKKEYERYAHRDSLFYQEQYYTEVEINKHLQQESQRSGNNNLKQATRALDTFFILNKLKLYCEYINYQKVISLKYDIFLIDEILLHLKQVSHSHIPAIEIYYNILLTLTDPDDRKHFDLLKKLLVAHINLFELSEQRIMYGYAQNYCIRMVNKGDVIFLKELFDIFKEVLDKKVILNKGTISPWDYKNITSTGLRLQEYDWVSSFIADYKAKLPELFRQNAYTYNWARYNFYVKNYDEVMKQLQNVTYEDVFYNLDSKAMLLKTYYELGESEALSSLLSSFKIFLHRNKLVSEHHRTNYVNFMIILKRLYFKTRGKAQLNRIKDELKNTHHIADANWLMEKIKEKF